MGGLLCSCLDGWWVVKEVENGDGEDMSDFDNASVSSKRPFVGRRSFRMSLSEIA